MVRFDSTLGATVPLGMLLIATLLVAGCGTAARGGSASPSRGGAVAVVAAENFYGNVAGQVGGPYVHVRSVESNPNTDPHSYEVSPSVAAAVSDAGVVIQNGLGYDGFMNKVESASPNRRRLVVDVAHLLHLPHDTPNPHLWYDPATMPAVASAIAADLSQLSPTHAAFFEANSARFTRSLGPWLAAIARFKKAHVGAPVATTEPVADYLLQAVGADDLTPFRLQADIMNGLDPSPQDVSAETGLLSGHKVGALVYNQQVTDPVTQSFLGAAKSAGIPVVGVYETMPTPGYDYQTWMLAETGALTSAIAHRASTVKL